MAAPDFAPPNLYAEPMAPPRKERRAFSKGLFLSALTLAEAPADFLASALGMLAAFPLRASLPMGAPETASARLALAISAIFALLVTVLMHRGGDYRGGSGLLRIRETERAIRIPAQSLLLLFVIGVLLGLGLSGFVFLAGAAAVPGLLILRRQIFFAMFDRLRCSANGAGRVVVYGSGDTGRSVVSTLLQSPRLGLKPVAVIDHNPLRSGARMLAMGYRGRAMVAVRPGPVTPALLHLLECDLLLLAAPNLSRDQLAGAIYAASQTGSDVALPAGPFPGEESRRETIDIDGFLFTSTRERPGPWFYAAAKRVTDLAVSSFLLVLLAPLLFLIAILIRLGSPGPALFVQKRVGRNGKLFDMYKFRSMYADAPKYSLSPTSLSDPRITRIGRFLRHMSLDELPQLLNVFMGSMSLVGPRPEMPFIVERYNSRNRQRLQVTPGITGLWQLSADRAFPIHQNTEYDLYYIRNRSFCLDLAILIHTLLFAMNGGT